MERSTCYSRARYDPTLPQRLDEIVRQILAERKAAPGLVRARSRLTKRPFSAPAQPFPLRQSVPYSLENTTRIREPPTVGRTISRKVWFVKYVKPGSRPGCGGDVGDQGRPTVAVIHAVTQCRRADCALGRDEKRAGGRTTRETIRKSTARDRMVCFIPDVIPRQREPLRPAGAGEPPRSVVPSNFVAFSLRHHAGNNA